VTWAFQDVGVYVNLDEGDVEGVDEVFVRTFAEALDTSYIGAYDAPSVSGLPPLAIVPFRPLLLSSSSPPPL
jgi:hypothetical protein